MTFTFAGFLISVAPLMMLVVLLLARKYPGESIIVRLRTLVDGIGHEHVRRNFHSRHLPGLVSMVRGGRLIACSLAGRGPPVLS